MLISRSQQGGVPHPNTHWNTYSSSPFRNLKSNMHFCSGQPLERTSTFTSWKEFVNNLFGWINIFRHSHHRCTPHFPSLRPLQHPSHPLRFVTAWSLGGNEILWECAHLRSDTEEAGGSKVLVCVCRLVISPNTPRFRTHRHSRHAHLTTQQWVNVDTAVEVYKTQIALFSVPISDSSVSFFRGHQRIVRSNKSLQIFPFYFIILSWCYICEPCLLTSQQQVQASPTSAPPCTALTQIPIWLRSVFPQKKSGKPPLSWHRSWSCLWGCGSNTHTDFIP